MVTVIVILMVSDTWVTKEKHQSIYNFSKYVEQSENQRANKVIVRGFEKSSIVDTLPIMSATKMTKESPFETRRLNSANSPSTSQIPYVAESANKNYDQILSRPTNYPVLVITDMPGQAKKRTSINF